MSQSVNFENLRYPHEATFDYVPAWRAEHPAGFGQFFGSDIPIYPARSDLAETGYLFLSEDKTFQFHSEARTVEEAFSEALATKGRQIRTMREIRNIRRYDLHRLVMSCKDLVLDPDEFRELAGLCKAGFRGFCQEHGLDTGQVRLLDAYQTRKADSRVMLPIFHAVKAT